MSSYYISAVKMDSTGSHIESVKVHKRDNNSVDNAGSINSRKFISELISDNSVEFLTGIYDKTSNKWTRGAKVEITKDGYITTDPNNTTKDNLGNLPKLP